MTKTEQFTVRFSGPDGDENRPEEVFEEIEFEEDDSNSSEDRAFEHLWDTLCIYSRTLIVLMAVFMFVMRPIRVEGESMYPTLNNRDGVAISSFIVKAERGDIVVVAQPWKRHVPIIKRVIGVGGDKIDIDFDEGTVSVNGKVLEEDYTLGKTHLSYDVVFPVTVPEGQVFVMGDNRNDSLDSRSTEVGFIDENWILGKTLFRFYPFFQFKIGA